MFFLFSRIPQKIRNDEPRTPPPGSGGMTRLYYIVLISTHFPVYKRSFSEADSSCKTRIFKNCEPVKMSFAGEHSSGVGSQADLQSSEEINDESLNTTATEPKVSFDFF